MDLNKEKKEVVEAGKNALDSLREAKKEISVARSLGIWDILGGTTLISLGKHFKINKAKMAI